MNASSLVELSYEFGLVECAQAFAHDRVSRLPTRRHEASSGGGFTLLRELCRLGPSPARARLVLDDLLPPARGYAAADLCARLLVPRSENALLVALGRAGMDCVEAERLDIGSVASIASGESAQEIVRLVGEAHLPRLACALLSSDALADASELLLDAELYAALPDPATLIGGGAPEDLELAGYVSARADLATDPAAVAERLESEADFDYARQGEADIVRFARTHLVRAEAAMFAARLPVPFDVVDHVARLYGSWRYAQRVHITAAFHLQLLDAAFAWFDAYLARFGNDAPLWRAVLSILDVESSAYQRVRARLSAELLASPHDAVLWAALVPTLGVDAALNELRQRLAQHARVSS
ncbi:MAG TPA: hypothetical protein VN947_02510 [Polyangia bacterium]|nr:hypothetical protein [Polyangia bacterium]